MGTSTLNRRKRSTTAYVLKDGGEMGALIRAFDWSQTPAGAMVHWPANLRIALNICLASDTPMAVLWGSECVQFYNEACLPILGARHPQSLGQPCRECWPEIWDIVGPLCASVLQTGRSVQREDIPLPLSTNAGMQERFFTLALHPIHNEDGRDDSVDGILCAISETTARVLEERRSRVIRTLATTMAGHTDASVICRKACDVLRDDDAAIPFAALYLRDAHARQLVLAECLRMDQLPALVSLANFDSAALDVATATQGRLIAAIRHTATTGERALIADAEELAVPLSTLSQSLEVGANDGQEPGQLPDLSQPRHARHAPHPIAAIALPLTTKGKVRIDGVLVTGIAPCETWNESASESYHRYLLAVAGQIAAALVESRIIEVERQRALAQAGAAMQANMLAASIEAMTDGIYIFGGNGELVQWNGAARNMTPPQLQQIQINPDTLAGAAQAAYVPCDEHGTPFPPDERPHRRALRGETFTGAQAVDVLVHRPDGRDLFLNVSGAPIYDTPGHIYGAVMVARDITERRMLERRTATAMKALLAMAETLVWAPSKEREEIEILQENLENLGGQQDSRTPIKAAIEEDAGQTMRRLGELAQSVLGCLRLGITLLDRDVSLRLRPIVLVGAASPEGEQTWKAMAESLSLRDYLPDDQLARLMAGEVVVADPIANARPGVPNFGIHQVLVAPMRVGTQLMGVLSVDYGQAEHRFSPEELELAAAVAKLAGVAAEREELLGEWREARINVLSLRAVTQRMDEVLNLTGHEIKGPLTTIRASMQLVKRMLNRRVPRRRGAYADLAATVEEIGQYVLRTEQQTTRLTRLVDDLLDTSRIQTGKLELRVAPCSLASVVQNVIEDQQISWPNRAIRLHLPTKKTLTIRADAVRIEQVVANYVTNALKYSSDEQPVEVWVDAVGGQARVAVHDRGPGLPPEEWERVWERYHQVKSIQERSNAGLGLGLGLYISKTIIELHHGHVGVESNPGKGSTFFFTLPLEQAQA